MMSARECANSRKQETPMKGGGVLAYWFDLNPSVQQEWADWYIRDHMPSRVNATFTGARCFRAVSGQPGFMALYDTPSPEALIAPDYLALLSRVSDGDRAKRGWYEGTIRGCCRKLADFGFGQGGFVGSVRFSARPSAGEANAIAATLAERLAKIERIGRASLLEADPAIRAKMDQARVNGQSDGAADKILTVECSSPDDVQNALTQLAAMPGWREIAEPASVIIGCYQLLYSIAK
jgi:hypothetical protein